MSYSATYSIGPLAKDTAFLHSHECGVPGEDMMLHA
jgi:hypothetical protein